MFFDLAIHTVDINLEKTLLIVLDKFERGTNCFVIDATIYAFFSVLSHFGVTSRDYAVIFTKNTSDSLRLVSEIVSDNDIIKGKSPILSPLVASFLDKRLLICHDSHTSVHGIRHLLPHWITDVETFDGINESNVYNLFIFTAMSNFSGKKYNPDIIQKLRGFFNLLF